MCYEGGALNRSGESAVAAGGESLSEIRHVSVMTEDTPHREPFVTCMNVVTEDDMWIWDGWHPECPLAARW